MSYLPFTETVTQLRPATVGDTNLYVVIDSIDIFIQPLDDTFASSDASFTKTFRAFCDPDLDIKLKDKIIRNDESFIVKGVSYYNYGTHKHKFAIIEKVAEYA